MEELEEVLHRCTPRGRCRKCSLPVCMQLYGNQRAIFTSVFTSSQAALGQEGQAGSGTPFLRHGRACISESPLTWLSSPSFKETSPPAQLSTLALLIQPLGLHPATLSSQYWFWWVVSRKFPSGLIFVCERFLRYG